MTTSRPRSVETYDETSMDAKKIPDPFIRRATAGDAEAVAGLAERTFRDTFADTNTKSDMDQHCATVFGPDIQRREILDPKWATFVVEHDRLLIGFAQVRLDQATDCVPAKRPCELYRIYVERAWHGRGVAQQLMDEVLSLARRELCDWVWLGVWENNPKAQSFYNKYGFEAFGEHTFMLGTDEQRDLIMAMPVAANR